MIWNCIQFSCLQIADLQKSECCVIIHITPLHRGAFCQFPFRWIYYCHSSKSIGMETGKTHLCALCKALFRAYSVYNSEYLVMTISCTKSLREAHFLPKNPEIGNSFMINHNFCRYQSKYPFSSAINKAHKNTELF